MADLHEQITERLTDLRQTRDQYLSNIRFIDAKIEELERLQSGEQAAEIEESKQQLRKVREQSWSYTGAILDALIRAEGKVILTSELQREIPAFYGLEPKANSIYNALSYLRKTRKIRKVGKGWKIA